MELKGSKTEANLWKAFAGESQARNKYDYFASRAKKDGYEQIAAIFQELSLIHISNHTLPTSGTARFSSPLGVDDFCKRSSFLYYSPQALADAAPRIAEFARREGLEAHARSVCARAQQAKEVQP